MASIGRLRLGSTIDRVWRQRSQAGGTINGVLFRQGARLYESSLLTPAQQQMFIFHDCVDIVAGTGSLPGVQPPLDTISGAVAAFSLRKLRTAWAGKAKNIRRTSDSAVQDIGFSGNDFDVAALNAFIKGSTGFAQISYDQTGNGHDASNLAFATQPQVLLGATPTLQPALAAASTAVGMTATVPAVTIPFTLAAVVSRTGGLTNYSSCAAFFDGTNPPALFYLNSPGLALGNTGLDSISAAATDNQFHSVIGVMNGASSSLTIDGVTTNGSLSNHPGSTLFGPVPFALVGSICEAVYFNRALSGADIATLTASHRAYWGTP